MNGLEIGISFYDQWTWAIFIAIGLVMVLLEVIIGVDTAFDLVIIGSILIIAGAVTIPFHNWWLTLVVAVVLSVVYLSLLRSYVRRRMRSGGLKSNIDAYIGQSAVVIKDIEATQIGHVRVGTEEWRARADEPISAGEEVIIESVTGITLTVKKKEV
jgi:membrane protein implicated in regulation of membrane protease activity